MNKILQLKHWQIFLILLLLLFISNTTIENFSILNDILGIIGVVLFFLILLMYGHCLYSYLPDKIELNYNLFIINVFLVTTTLIAVAILTLSNKVTFTGIYALPGFYLFYAFLHTIAFPAKVLKSIELNREANLEEYIGLFVMIIFWPFCVWFFQPRVNRVTEQELTILNNYKNISC